MNVTPNNQSRTYLPALRVAAVAASLLALSLRAQTPAPAAGLAPTPPAADDSTVKLEQYVTIGSRFNDRTVVDSPVPIDVLSSQELQKSGYTELGQALSVLVPSIDFPRSANTDGTDSVRPLTLRNLGPGETLVLLDDKRYHTSALVNLNGSVGRGDAAVDLNTIPAFALSGAEVLRDGAAAQYGSDAIAGVVNLRLRRDIGFSAETELGQFYNDDGATLYGAANYGVKIGDTGFVNLTLYFKDTGQTDRSGPDLRQQYFGKSATTGALVAPGTTAGVINGIADPREATFNSHDSVFGDPVAHSRGLFLNMELPSYNGWTVYANGGGNHRLSYSYASWRRPADSTNVRAIYPNGFQPEINPHTTDYNFTVGVKGTVAGFGVDVSETYGSSLLKYYTIDSLNVSYGAASPTRFYDGQMLFQQSTSTVDLTREIPVPVLSAPLKAAAGGEFRYEEYSIKQGDVASWANGGQLILDGPSAGTIPAFGAQGFPGFRPTDQTDKDRENVAGYVDVENQITSQFDIDIAGRAEHYSDAGNTETGKVAGIYKLTNWLNARASFSNGFRAPELQQEYFTTTSSTILTIGGVTGPYDVKTFQVTSPAAIALGATPLKPEQSTNFSGGFTVNPTENFSASADYYNIGVTNRIVLSSNFTGTAVANYLAASGYPGIDGGRYFTNGVDTRTQGFDVTTRYQVALSDGDKVTFTGGYNYTDTLVTYAKQTPANVLALTGGIPIFDRQNILRFERGSPMDKVVLSQSYDLGKLLTFLIREDYYGKVLSPGAYSAAAPNPIIGTSATDQWLNPEWLFDAEVSWHINRHLSLAIGADNILNTYPSKFDAANNTAGLAQYSSFSPFGFDGGYYYGRMDIKF